MRRSRRRTARSLVGSTFAQRGGEMRKTQEGLFPFFPASCHMGFWVASGKRVCASRGLQKPEGSGLVQYLGREQYKNL